VSTKDLVFFIDRSLGKKQVAAVLREAGVNVEIHDDHFDSNAQDTEWLPAVAAKGWVILTKDEKIAYRALEQLAVSQANAKLFVLVSGNLSGPKMAAAFKSALKTMQRFINHHPAPFIAKVYKSGEVRAWKERDNLIVTE
jgi:predicted nuclease of predicted toxin-antitoxin system